jgi:hypothetical protein
MFPCLHRIFTINKDEDSMKYIIQQVSVCIILHNLLMDSSYPKEWLEVYEEDAVQEEAEYEEQFVPA